MSGLIRTDKQQNLVATADFRLGGMHAFIPCLSDIRLVVSKGAG